jgi:hypothetical protein
LEFLILRDEKILKEEIQDLYLNDESYDEVEIDFGEAQVKKKIKTKTSKLSRSQITCYM